MHSLYKNIFSCLLFCTISVAALAQDLNSTKPSKKRLFTVYAGLGPNFYINNLEVSKKYVREWNMAFVTRIMWEPEHFLSLGFETGYNGLYSIKEAGTNSEVKISNAAIPLQLVISMKFLKQFYGNFTMGQSILLNKVSTTYNGVSNTNNASNVSLGDFGAAIGYRKSISERFYLGTELKGYYSAKLDDQNLGLVVMTGYRF
jgi:hypothetical protein